MPMVVKYFQKSEEDNTNRKDVQDEESELDKFEKYSIQRYEVANVNSNRSSISNNSGDK